MTGYVPLTDLQVRALLAVAMSYDNRKPGAANVEAWAEAADRGRWTFEAAREAVHRHYSESTEFLMPAHVTALVRAARQQSATPVEVVAQIEAAKPADPQRTGQIMRRLAAELGWRTAQPHAALGVECPHCHAQPGKPCARQRTRGAHRGEWQHLTQPHDSRIQAAQLINETTED